MGTARGRVKHGTLRGIRRNGVGCSRFNGETLSFPLTETISYFFFYREMEDIFLLFYYFSISKRWDRSTNLGSTIPIWIVREKVCALSRTLICVALLSRNCTFNMELVKLNKVELNLQLIIIQIIHFLTYIWINLPLKWRNLVEK